MGSMEFVALHPGIGFGVGPACRSNMKTRAGGGGFSAVVMRARRMAGNRHHLSLVLALSFVIANFKDKGQQPADVQPRALAAALIAVLVHVSTDYVFSGSRRQRYVETDPVDPLSVYGASKAAGEMLVRGVWPRHFIVRTSGLYGVAGSRGKGGNFVDTMLRLAESGEVVRVVDDQVLTPTHAADLALQIARLAVTDAYGTYHATSQGQCSWYEFAAEILRQAGLQAPLERQTTAEAGREAPRPPYSVLDNHGLRRLGIDVMPAWRQALTSYLAARSASVP